MTKIKQLGPGLLLCLALAVPCWLLGKAFPLVGGPVFAILAGMIVTLFYRNKAGTQAGIVYTSKKILQYAVILLGFGLNLSEIAKVGATSLPIIISTISTSLIVSFALYKLLNMPANILPSPLRTMTRRTMSWIWTSTRSTIWLPPATM